MKERKVYGQQMLRADRKKENMINIWRKVLCGACMALMLTGCGSTEDNTIRFVEEEAIAKQSPAKGEEAGAVEKEVSEMKKEAGVEGDSVGGEDTVPEGGSMEGVGKQAVVTMETETQEYTEGEAVIMTASLDHVTVAVEGNEPATQAIMEKLEKNEQAYRESIAETLEWAKQDELLAESGMACSEEHGYAIKRNDGRILSFSVLSSGFEGGAHGYYMEYGLNFDAQTGAVLSVADIARDEAAFQEICVQEMLQQCEDLRAQGLLFEEEMLDYAGGLQGILENKMEGEEWYFTEEGICFISNIYEIAPYAAGNFKFDIPYEMVNETLKEEYRRS